MIYLYCGGKSYGKDSDMSDGTEISGGIEAFGYTIPYEDRKKSRKKLKKRVERYHGFKKFC